MKTTIIIILLFTNIYSQKDSFEERQKANMLVVKETIKSCILAHNRASKTLKSYFNVNKNVSLSSIFASFKTKLGYRDNEIIRDCRAEAYRALRKLRKKRKHAKNLNK